MFFFGFVRNPWSRLVSLYHYKRAATGFDMRFEDWIVQLAHDQPCIPPQTRFLFSTAGKQLVSYIGCFERLAEDLDYIGDKIGVSFTCVRRLNATQHGHYQDYYDPRTEEIVRRLFAPDIERFGYAF